MASRHSRPEIVAVLLNEYSFLASVTSFTELELQDLFTPEEMEEINEFLAAMKTATDDNAQRNKLIDNIEQYAGAALGIIKKMANVPV